VKAWARVTGAQLYDVIELGAHAWEFYVRKA